jgi:hypothetical protein
MGIIKLDRKNFLPTKLPIRVPAEKVNEIIEHLNDHLYDNEASVDTIVEKTSGSGVTIDGVTLKDGVITPVATSAVGTAGAATVTIADGGMNKFHVTTLTLTNFIVGNMGSAAASKAIGNKVFSFPAGVHLHHVSYFSLGFTGAGTAKTPVVALGSIVGVGAIATLHATLPTADDYTAESAIANITGTAKVLGPVGAVAGLMTGISLNKVGDVKDVFLNAACAWAADNTGNLTATGTIVLVWTKLD